MKRILLLAALTALLASSGQADVDRSQGRMRGVAADRPSWWDHYGWHASARPVAATVAPRARVHVVPHTSAWRAGYGRPYRYTRFRGHSWYGFYMGPRHYWARWYGNRWWWYDAHVARWSYWTNGYWWWIAPGGFTYVYVDDVYYPYRPGLVAVAAPAPAASPGGYEAPPTYDPGTEAPAASLDQSATSPDGKRMIQIVGADAEAFLYDMRSGKAVFMKYLDKNVGRARFAGGIEGTALEILLDFRDSDKFRLYDENGNPKSQAPKVEPATAPDAPPLPAPLPG